MFDYIIGLDNGVSAKGIAVLGPDDLVIYSKLPVKKTLSYTKEEKHITRIDVPKLRALVASWILPVDRTLFIAERPMVNPHRWSASLSAIRALEATLIVFEEFGFAQRIEDSKTWQSELLPGIKGSDELKAASLKLGIELFPKLKLKGDADSLLIATWAKRNKL